MTPSETIVLKKVVVNLITRRAGSRADGPAVAAAARRIYDDLAVVLVPLISQAGIEALLARALHLARREYPLNPAGEEQVAEPFGQVTLWLERQHPSIAIDAATVLFAAFAALLATLIGEALTTRYLRKAWPEGFSDTRPEGKQA